VRVPGQVGAAALLLLLVASCGGKRADYDAIRAENDQLRHELALVQDRADAPSPVRLDRTEQFALPSANVDQTFQIKVSLPRGYDPDAGSYPVLYVTDAETNFGGISYIVQRLVKDGLIPEILVVGVAYGTDYDTFYDLRSRDLTPRELPDLRIGGRESPTGGADHFLAFLEHELFPAIEQRYRVKPDDRAMYGHSYGGLFGCYVFLTRPELFQRYLLLSPSLWYDDELLLREVGARRLDLPRTTLYLASGELESRIDDEMSAFADSLRRENLPNLVLKAEVLDNETHRTVFGRGFTNGLRFIYGER